MNDINIEYFIKIVKEGSLTEASKKLFVSQPSLSQYIKRLEKKTKTKLFNRNTSPLTLTYTGQRYYEYVLRLKNMEDNIYKELLDIKQEKSGLIKLGIPLWRGACILPQILPDFTKKYPNIKFDLFETRARILIDALLDNKIDFAVINIDQNFNFPELLYETIFMERILLAAPMNNPYVKKIIDNSHMSNGYPICSLDLINYIPLILSKPGQNITYAVNYTIEQSKIEPNILLSTENQTTAINLVSTGLGCTFVPEAGAKVCHRPNQVIYLAVDSPTLIWPLAAVYRKDVYLSKRCRLFIDSLKATFHSNSYNCTK